MLPAAARMRHRQSFERAVRAGHRATRDAVTVHLAREPNREPSSRPEVGFIVGRGVGPAVIRNRVRRRLRHIVRDRLDVLTAQLPGAAIVVRAAPAAAGSDFPKLAADFDRALAAVLSKERAGAAT
jgi:ribonuclease P protein component